MKSIITIVAIIVLFPICSIASESKIDQAHVLEITQKMEKGFPNNCIFERTNYQGVNPEFGNVKYEHVFIQSGIRYTVWLINWYENAKPSYYCDELRVSIRNNGTSYDYPTSGFSIMIDDINKFSFYYHLSNNVFVGFDNRFGDYDSTVLSRENAMKVLKKHLEVVYKAYQ